MLYWYININDYEDHLSLGSVDKIDQICDINGTKWFLWYLILDQILLEYITAHKYVKNMQKCSVDKNTDALILHPQTIDRKHQTTPNEYNVGTCILIKSNNVPASSYIFSLRVKNGRIKLRQNGLWHRIGVWYKR